MAYLSHFEHLVRNGVHKQYFFEDVSKSYWLPSLFNALEYQRTLLNKTSILLCNDKKCIFPKRETNFINILMEKVLVCLEASMGHLQTH